MNEIIEGLPAPDFSLADAGGKMIRLSDFHGKFVVLALLRGFG